MKNVRGKTGLGGQELQKRRGREREVQGLPASSEECGRKERGNGKSLSLRGGLLRIHTEPYAATQQHKYVDYIVIYSRRTLG